MGGLEAVHDALGRQMDRDRQVHEGIDAGVDRLLIRPRQGDEDGVWPLQAAVRDGRGEVGRERGRRIVDAARIAAAQEGDVDDGEADIPGLVPRDERHHILLAPDQEDALGGNAAGLAADGNRVDQEGARERQMKR